MKSTDIVATDPVTGTTFTRSQWRRVMDKIGSAVGIQFLKQRGVIVSDPLAFAPGKTILMLGILSTTDTTNKLGDYR